MRVVSDSESADCDKNADDGVTDVICGKDNAWKDAASNGAARRRMQLSLMVKMFLWYLMFSRKSAL
jgi:hypothetical protein